MELAYEAALQDAYTICLEMLLKNIAACGYTNEELKPYADSLRTFVKDDGVAAELLEAIRNPLDSKLPHPETLAMRWQELDCNELPGDLWTGVALAFRRQATKQAFVNEPLRQILNAQNLDAVRELLERDGGVRPEVRQDKYAVRMRTKYASVDLANLMPAYAENPGQLVIRDVFVPQMLKENPLAVELPKDFEKRLREKGIHDLDERSDGEQRELADEQRERLSTVYVSQSPKPVLEVIADPSNRLVMLVGEPGSGKSTLMRYLLLGVLEPPKDASTGQPLPWTTRFRQPTAFPLLIELRDFHATRVTNDEVDSFLDYALYMGRTEQYFLDDQWLDRTLHGGPSLVLFDGLDEIFERADREKVMQEIVGFAQRYPQARIVVTSRPVGYRDAILRPAGFRHFALQDLDERQIVTFTRGWFTLTFPQQPEQATQRIDRVLSSIRRSRPILLLAGNPMLLTIMALLAREQELPRERAAFYEAAVNVLCHHWDANRNLTLPGTDYLRLDDKKELLRRVAMRMQTGKGGLKGNAIHESDLEAEVTAWFTERFKQPEFEAIKSARLMIHQLHERNYILCVRGPRLYGFVHRTFLEFLTAAEYVDRFNIAKTMSIEELVTLYDAHCRDEDWREVLRLIAGRINERFVGRIVEHLATLTGINQWDGRTPLPELPLAIYCLSEARNFAGLETAGEMLMKRVLQILMNVEWEPNLVDYFGNAVISASAELGSRWPGRQELTRCAVTPPAEIRMGSFYWAEFVAIVAEDRHFVTVLSAHSNNYIRAYSMRPLAAKWPDESTRELLRARAVEDKDGGPRSAALRSLAEKWPDDSTRELLRARAVEDQDAAPRRAALQSLAEKWPDESTREFLRARAVEDQDANVRGSACSVLGGMYSEFGRIVGTKDLDGRGPYLDPLRPISSKHIEKAAAKAGIAAGDLEAQIDSLSQHLGWDIRVGARR